MDIKRTAIAALIGLTLLSNTSASAKPIMYSVPVEFDYYINAALQVYIDVIPPSVHTSEVFLSYMQNQWRQKPCLSQMECKKMGLRVAHEFASIYRA